MRRLRRGTTVLGIVAACLGAFACQPRLGTRPPESGPPDKRPPPPPAIVYDPFSLPFALVDSKPEQSACTLPEPERDKWTAVPDPRAQPNVQAPVLPRRYDGEATGLCVYKWRNESNTPSPADFERIGAVPDGAVIGTRDHSPSAFPALPKTVSDPLLKTFDKVAFGIPPERWAALAKKYVDKPAKPVRVAVVDTTPKDLNSRDHSLHGFTISRVIGRLTCGDSASPECAARIRPYLALPMIGARTEDLQNGGRYGTFFHLYDALSRALSEWQPKNEHLIINLSLGWDPVKTDDNDPRVERIRGLLERASCMGALIVAGAGNSTGTEGPIEPGAFEELPAPNAKRCADLKAPQPPAGPAASKAVRTPRGAKAMTTQSRYAPLVHAVGAVDQRDQRLMADRRWGQPRLSALGLSVMVPGPGGIPFTPPLTGSSVAAAIVSGIAATVWSVLPDLDAASVMAIVYGSGVELDGGEKSKRARTEFCLGEHFGPCLDKKVHRAFLCGALAQALAQAGANESLTCDPSISTEAPQWPVTPTVPVPPREPCRVPACGFPVGPLPNQRVSGIASHGFANCPGCSVSINLASLLGTLQGNPGFIPPMPTNFGLAAVVDIAARRSVRSYVFNPAPPFDQPMSQQPQMSGVPANASAATITWYYWTGVTWEPDIPLLLGINFQ